MRENKTRYWIGLIIFVVLSTVVIPLVSGQDASSAIVQINDPGNGANVEYECHVQGTSTGLGDPNLHLYILVQGVGTSKWWVQPPTIVGGDGSWVGIAYLGEKNKGNNEKFAIKAIITNKNFFILNFMFKPAMENSLIHASRQCYQFILTLLSLLII